MTTAYASYPPIVVAEVLITVDLVAVPVIVIARRMAKRARRR